MSLPSREGFLSLSLNWRKNRPDTLEPTEEPVWSQPQSLEPLPVYMRSPGLGSREHSSIPQLPSDE